MRNVYLICYDIACPKRWRKIHKTMKGFGTALQYSVFRAELTRLELHTLKESLWPLMNENEDRVMIVNLGPIEGRGDECVEFWGNPLEIVKERGALIV